MDILFAVMPFPDLERPALGVSLLQAQVERAGFTSAVRYLNFDLAEMIGLDLYDWFAQCGGDDLAESSSAPAVSLVGEWFFADLVFPDSIPHEAKYVDRFLAVAPGARKRIPRILKARRRRNEFIDQCVGNILKESPTVVGFTSTFHQTCASLAVATRLKHGADPPIILFGGANCEGEMGLQLLRSFPWIDYVCTGEGDEILPDFLRHLLRDGVSGRAELRPRLIRNMDALPIPNYRAYFERLRSSPLASRIQPRLLLETARGCWWGEKQHCIFCGLNGAAMSYRSKSPERVIEELSHLIETYGLGAVDCVDNILDHRYLQTVFPQIIKKGWQADLFFETKSNLRFDQLRLLRAAGERAIQPGIESFSNAVLKLMRKGCTAAQNIQLLRWCDELGIHVFWNLIYGFPGEPASEYPKMTQLLPMLHHLQPPQFCERVRLDRFSPLFFDPVRFGITNRRPVPAYSYVFPLRGEALENIAYFFEFDYSDAGDPHTYGTDLSAQARAWRIASQKKQPRLDLFRAASTIVISDTRSCALKPDHVYTGLAASIYIACDTARNVPSLARDFQASPDEIHAILESMIHARLMVEVEGQYLSLARFRNRAPG